jgi:hypothetical protein
VLKEPIVTYATLAPRQRQILEAKRVADRLGARAWLDLLVPLARFDVAGDRARASSKAWMVRGLVGAFLGIFVVAMSGGSPLAVPVPVTSLALGIGAGLRYRKLLKIDLSNNLSRLVVPLLRVLDEETSAGSPVALDLDLRPANIPDKLERTENPPPVRGYFDMVERHYRDPWMTGKAELAVGARLEWTVVDEVVELQRKSRSASGKTKTKTKYKKRSLMAVEISLPDAQYAVGPASGDSPDGQKVRLKSTEKRQTFKVAQVVKVSSLEPPHVALLLDLVAVAFRRATPVPPEAPRP